MTDRDADRQKRLREALRENLKRRKSQLRGRADRPENTAEAPADALDDPPEDDR